MFYRCFLGIRTEFLCPKMLSSDRLWWIQHSSSQETPQTSAACVWPCETKKQCNSPGGTIVQTENGNYTESIIETERIWRSSSCGEEKLANNDIFKISDTSFTCNGLSEGSFYSSKYCNIFHRCTSGKRKGIIFIINNYIKFSKIIREKIFSSENKFFFKRKNTLFLVQIYF